MGPLGGWRRTPVTVTSKAASRRAISVPTAPAPTMHAAVPASERPAGCPHRPGSKPFEASGRRRASARRSATACSATGTALRPGMLATHPFVGGRLKVDVVDPDSELLDE